MKVQSTSSNVTLNGLTKSSRNEPAPSEKNQPSADVNLSPAARSLAALSDDSADIQTAKVQQLREALASGELSIKPERIADGLLASARELLK